MDSRAWQQQIAETTAAITTKELRLKVIASEKAAAISDHKRLMTLEQEESAIPVLIEQLKKRLPLLGRELENELRAEAGERHQVLATQGKEAAAAVTASSMAIRSAMGELLNRIAEARNISAAHELLIAEQRFLEVRFSLPPLQLPVGDRLGGDERGRFLRQCEKSLQHNVPMTAWDRSRVDFLERQRRQEAEHRREAAGRTIGSTRIHYSDGADFQADERRREERRRSAEDASHEPTTVHTHWSDNVTTARSH